MHLKIDLHVHSAYSDGLGDIHDILKTARLKGLDGLVITDHDTLKGYYEAKASYSDLYILPGYEVETDAGHVLILGLEQLPPITGIVAYEDLIWWTRDLGGLTVLAHPAAGRFRLRRWMHAKTDAIEVLNASYPTKYFITRGLRLAERLNLPRVGGSDAHHSKTVGDAYTIIEANKPDTKYIIEAIKDSHANIEGNLSPIRQRLRSGTGYLSYRISNKIKYAPSAPAPLTLNI